MPYSPNGSPIMARQNAPVFIIIIVLLLIAALIFLVWLLSKQISNYYNSEEYLEKERTRPTNAKDIKKLKENGTLIRIGGAKGGWWKVVK